MERSRESMEEYAEAMQQKACEAHEKHGFHDVIVDPDYDQEDPFPRVNPSKHGKGYTSYP
jgi:acetyl-CoA acetyltransferase